MGTTIPRCLAISSSRWYSSHLILKQKEIAILTRRIGESINITLPTGECITAAVLGVKGNQVRIGTDAPDDVVIVREELLERADD